MLKKQYRFYFLRVRAGLIAGHHGCNILVHRTNGLDVKFFHQNLGHGRRQKGRKCGSKADALDTEGKQGQEHGHGFLLIPGNVLGDGQIINVVQTKHLFEFQGNDRQGVGIVALTRIQYPGNTSDIP